MRISDWSSDVCSSDLPNADARQIGMRRPVPQGLGAGRHEASEGVARHQLEHRPRLFAFELILVEIARLLVREIVELVERFTLGAVQQVDRKSTRLNSSH